jgi:putative phage-type endonuclease
MLDHESRAQGIGGSEIAKIAGVSPWGSGLEVWLDKKHGIRKEVTGHHVERGQHLESGILGWYEERIRRETGDRSATVIVDQPNYVHPRYSIVRATPDGLLVTDASIEGNPQMDGPPSEWAERVDEVKCPSRSTEAHWAHGVPEYVLPQVTWEMAVTGLYRADVIALIDGDIRIYPVDFDDDLFCALHAIAQSWWDRYIVGDEEPPPDASEEYRQWLQSQFPRVVRPELEQAGSRQEDLIGEYLEIKAELRETETRRAQIYNALCREIGDGAGLKSPIATAKWIEVKGRRTLDTAALAERIDLEKYYKRGLGYRRLDVREV